MIIRELNYDNAKTIAETETKRTKENHVIITSYIGRTPAFRVLPEREYNGNYLELVRYTCEDKCGDILQDNGDGGFDVTDGQSEPIPEPEQRPTGKRKRKAE